ncbi:MAG TPA: threonine-phosphate decarboxylase CobD [Nitrospirota bacterium]|nr:threonine-phosphate decarboxylase CobD [Nitrospirota bacterium]
MQNTECDTENFLNEGSRFPRASRAHGGNIYEAAKQYGLDIKKIIDFSSNVNALGPSSMARRAARWSLSIIDRYPDPEMTDLRRAIARYYGIKPEQVACDNGANGLIHLIPRVFRPRKVLIPIPTFSEYASAAQDAGCGVVPFPLRERDGFRVDPVEMSFAMKGVDMAFLCNPNNPTGQMVPKQEMLEIVSYAHQQGTTLVLDEAFMDFLESESMVKEAVQTSRIICLRSFTKFFGMPGLRIGYAISDEVTIAELRKFQEPWTVNIPAERAAIAALDDWGYIKKTRRLIRKERDRMLSALRLLPGVETYPGSANFVLFKLVSADVHTLRQKLGYRGLLVRDCTGFPGLDSRFIRVAIRTRRENNRLIKALRELLIP